MAVNYKYLKISVYIIFISIFIVGVILAIISRLTIPGGYKAYSVLTGSMEPNIPIGSLILVQVPQNVSDIKKGDIITFSEPGYENKYITHRVIQIDDQKVVKLFKTQGDANPKSDPWMISYGSIQGISRSHIPYLGYILEFLKSPVGITLFILLPALYLVFLELKNITVILIEMKMQQKSARTTLETSKPKTKKKTLSSKPKKKVKKSKVPTAVLAALVLVLTFFINISPVYALFQTTPQSLQNNSITTGNWSVSGDVVINEVHWMGSSSSSADEWVELRNMTGSAVDLTGWVIENAGSGSNSITLSGSIPANGYYLLSNKSTSTSEISNAITSDLVTASLSLLNTGEQLTLKSDLNYTIDQTPTGSWAAGVNGGPNWQSMERNSTPGSGVLVASWHTCIDSGCKDTTFWDVEGANYGTPKGANLSSNDPTAPDYRKLLEESMNNLEASSSATQSSSLTIGESPIESTPSAEIPVVPEEISPTPSPSVSPTPSLNPEPSVESTATPSPEENKESDQATSNQSVLESPAPENTSP